MDLLLDLYGFVNVVLNAAKLVARTALLGSVLFWVGLALPLAGRLAAPDAARLPAIGRGAVLAAGGAALAVGLSGTALNALVLGATLDVPVAGVLGADFVLAAAAQTLATLALLGLALSGEARPGPGRRAALLLGALALVAATAAASHAMARTEGRPMLLAATALHAAGAGLWLGGLPALLAALRLDPAVARAAGRRYSAFAAAGVGLILLGVGGFWLGYIGGVEALYGTAYGAMSSTKAALLGLLLLLGLGNFLLLHRLGPAPARSVGAAAVPDAGLPRIRRFVECEMALGVAVLAVAASLTSVPPAADLPEDRVAWSEIAERFTPTWPRLSSPDHANLAIPALQSRLDAEWRARAAAEAERPRAFNPGEGLLPPRNAQDVAWSEYNHHWAGLMVLLVGLAALADATGRVPLARHWPLLFLGLAAFILVRSDPEAWPLGHIPLLESLRDPEVVQHKIAGLLVAGFAVAEWAVRLGRLRGRARYVFPVAMMAGGVLLLAHTHAIANVREALLVELSHLPLAVMAVAAGCARWTELRGPPALAGPARWIWPVGLVLIGLLLIAYREA